MNIMYRLFKKNIKPYLVLLNPKHMGILCDELNKSGMSYIVLDCFNFDMSQFSECCIWELSFSNISNFDLLNPKILYSRTPSSKSCCKNAYAVMYFGPHIKNDFILYGDTFFEYILPDDFFCIDLHYSANKCVLHYSNNRLKKHIEHTRQTVALFWGDGLGDLFICYYLLKKFFRQMQEENKDIVIFLYDRTKNNSIKTVFKFMFTQYNIKVIDIESIYLLKFYYLKLQKFYKCYDLLLTTKEYTLTEGLHLIDIYSKILGISETYDFNTFDCQNPIYKDILPDHEIKFIDDITKSDKPLIGLQFWTGPFDKPSYRCWEYSMVSQLDILTNEKYSLINLTPYPKSIYKNLNFIDASFLSVPGMSYLISKLNLVVSIDSLCGHIAAMTGTPSITLWMNGSSPLNMLPNQLILIGTRPLRNNISIVQKSPHQVSAQIVVQTIEKMMRKIIIPKKCFISYQDSYEGENVIFDYIST